MIHPYLGFILNPLANNPTRTKNHGGFSVSSFGFLDEKWPIQKREPGKVILGITGGSFAGWFGIQGIDTFLQELKRNPRFKDKEFQVIRLAIGGYKQPQQLLTLSYLFSLGAEFDILLNIDGFNEVALPIAEHLPKNVFPSFPRNWYYRANTLLEDTHYQSQIGTLVLLRNLRQFFVETLSRPPWNYSPTILLSWRTGDRWLENQIAHIQSEILAYKKVSKGAANFQAHGPGWEVDSQRDLLQAYNELGEIWERSSMTLAALSKAHGITYVHFLQRNQYLKGAKPIGPEEAKIALGDSPYRTGVINGYPELIKRGKNLTESGIAFHDLTMIFKNQKEPRYIDTCCHINVKGNEYLGLQMAALFLQSLE